MGSPYQRGQIIVARVEDPQGRNPKDRPCVVVGGSGSHVAVIGVTSALDATDPPDRVDLPYSTNPASPCHTGLTRPSAAYCRWQAVVRVEDVAGVVGHVSPEHLARIIARVGELRAVQSAAPPADQTG
ncbi:MAG: type II toxin-antitoxin system PemK/MazF family toxin [Gemmataceae bacterium]